MQDNIRYERFSVCFDCGVPQWICHRFQEDREGGWRRQAEGQCQYTETMIPVVVTGMVIYSEFGGTMMDRMSQHGVDIEENRSVNQWFGEKVRWGGEEAARINQVFWEFQQHWLKSLKISNELSRSIQNDIMNLS